MYTKHFINFVFVKEIEIVFLNLILDIISSHMKTVFTWSCNGIWANSIEDMIGTYIFNLLTDQRSADYKFRFLLPVSSAFFVRGYSECKISNSHPESLPDFLKTTNEVESGLINF